MSRRRGGGATVPGRTMGIIVQGAEANMAVGNFVTPPYVVLSEFCRRWQVTELAIFGSALRSDFGDASDVDVLVTFNAGAVYDIDDRDTMAAELSEMLGRTVDLVPNHAVRNPFIRHEIQATKRVLYAA